MNATKKQFIGLVVSLVIVVLAMWNVVFTRYVHYHSQNRSLRPDDYDLWVVTAADYRSLADPQQTTVHLEDGSVVTKAVAWNAEMFKPVAGGAQYVQVTTKGTAHLLNDLMPMLLAFLSLGVVGVIVSWPRTSKEQHGDGQTESVVPPG